MKTILLLIAAIILAAFIGTQFANPSSEVASVGQACSPSPVQRVSNPPEQSKALEQTPQPATIEDLRDAFANATTLEALDPIAQTLAEQDSAESVQVLLEGIANIKAWPVRAALAKNLRAISNPECLQTLLPALLNNYGRGNTILNEISDAIARLAQPETVEDLAALHWQASVQAGQGHKVLRTVACIRNPAAIRGLMKVASRDDSPALVAAANEALKAMAMSFAMR